MTGRPHAAFYAPLKAPDHPVPSGDRTVGRLYMQALEKAGFFVTLASRLRAYEPRGDATVQTLLLLNGDELAWRMLDHWKRGRHRPPDLWFTYHLYYKAPDLLGWTISQELGIPYIIAEPSHAPKRREGAWAAFHNRAERSIRAADRVILATTADGECVLPLREKKGGAIHLPPFLDTAAWPDQQPVDQKGKTVRLITVAMMRNGDKLASYRLLAEALRLVADLDWRLTLIGDGEARAEVEMMFAPFAGRVTFAGAVTERAKLSMALADHDIFVWPAVNEAYGMAPLEAALCGLAVVLGDEGGVRDVLKPGKTGLLVERRNPSAFSKALRGLIGDRKRIADFGTAGRRFVLGERSLDHAAATLANHLMPLVKQR